MKINKILRCLNEIIDDSLNEKILKFYFSQKTVRKSLNNNFEYDKLDVQLNDSKNKIKQESKFKKTEERLSKIEIKNSNIRLE